MKFLPWLFRIMLLVYIVLIFALVFAQFPSFDDIVPKYLAKCFGLPGSIRFYLTTLNGRYSSIPLFLSVGSSALLMKYYTWVLLAFNIISLGLLYSFVRWLLRTFFTLPQSIWTDMTITLSVFIIFFSSVPEPSSFTYWLATVETYTIPFFLLLILVSRYVALIMSERFSILNFVACAILSLVLAGANEFMMMLAIILPFGLGLLMLIHRRKIPVYLFVLMAISIGGALFSLSLGGNVERTGSYTIKQNILFSIIGGIYRLNQSTESFLSNPLFYLGCFAAYFASEKLKPGIREWFGKKRTTGWMELLSIYLVALAFHVAIRQIGGAVLPDRVSNIINCVLILGIWSIIIINGQWIRNKVKIQTDKGNRIKLITGFFSILLIFSAFTNELFRNLFAAPVHHYVLTDRIKRINLAKSDGKQSVVIPSYDTIAKQYLHDHFSEKVERIYRDEFPTPPSYTYFKDEPATDEFAYAYAEYYNIDTVWYGKEYFLRWGLMHKSLKKE